MRESSYEERRITDKVLVNESITCNCCGKTNKRNPNGDYMDYTDGLWDGTMKNFSFSWGYASSHDMESWDFDLCEDCIVNIIKTFKHVPEGFKLYDLVLDQARHQKVFENWKETGKWEEFKYHTYEELMEYKGCFRDEYLNNLIKEYHPGKDLVE